MTARRLAVVSLAFVFFRAFITAGGAPETGAPEARALTLTELPRSMGDLPAGLDDKGFPTVDINSIIRITLDEKEIRNRAYAFAPQAVDLDAGELSEVSKILDEEARLFSLMSSGSIGSPDQKALGEVSTILNNLFTIITDPGSPLKNLRPVFNEILGRDIPEKDRAGDTILQYRDLFTAVRNEVERFTKLINEESAEKVTIRLGGWIQCTDGARRAVHVPQFDTLDGSGFYEVPRFVMPADGSLLDQLKIAGKAAESFNNAGIAGLATFVAEYTGIGIEFENLKALVRTILDDDILKAYLNTPDGKSLPVSAVVTRMEKLGHRISALIQLAGDLKKSKSPLTDSLIVLAEVQEILGVLQTEFTGLSGDLLKISQSATAIWNDPDNPIHVQVRLLREIASSVIEKVTTAIPELALWRGSGLTEAPEAYEEFSEAVSRFDINELPTETQIDLRTTGPREDGDELEVVLALEHRGGERGTTSIEIQRRTVRMFRIDWYANLSVGVVFISPFNPSVSRPQQTKSRFMASPSYSVFLHKGSRDWQIWNEFLSIGLGVNIAAPDFDGDGNPEIALGGVLSTARDYIQGGVGYNIGLNETYWFFGIRLPLGNLSFPAASSEFR